MQVRGGMTHQTLKIGAVGLAAVLVALAAKNLGPDLVRYLKIRRM